MKRTKNEAHTGRSVIRMLAALALMISAMLVTCFLLPSKAYAADLPASGEGWELDADGNLTITSDDGDWNWGELLLRNGTNPYAEQVKSLTVAEGVTKLCSRTSGGVSPYTLPNLVRAELPSTLTSFPDAFQECPNLQTVVMKEGPESIDRYAFYGCSNLTSVSIPQSVTTIGQRAFDGCKKLSHITLPSGLTTLGMGVFSGSGLETIAIPGGVTTIPEQAFCYCESLKSVTIAEGVTSIGKAAFSDCESLTDITIPASVTSIGQTAFESSGRLPAITIPENVTEIGRRAFYLCKQLKDVTVLAAAPPVLTEGVEVFDATWFEQNQEKRIRVPKGKVAVYKAAWTDWEDYIADDTFVENLDPTRTEPVGTEGEEGYLAAYADTSIDVQGFTANAIIYSVDVEWGAMTFQYEASTWDATAHKTVEGAGWKVYDSEKNKVLDTKTDAINRIQVTNHSNAGVRAVLAYAGEAGYEDTRGSFAKAADDSTTSFSGSAISLATADNAKVAGTAGTPTVGTVYFMPDGIKEDLKKSDGITKWTQLGTITVSIETE